MYDCKTILATMAMMSERAPRKNSFSSARDTPVYFLSAKGIFISCKNIFSVTRIVVVNTMMTMVAFVYYYQFISMIIVSIGIIFSI